MWVSLLVWSFLLWGGRSNGITYKGGGFPSCSKYVPWVAGDEPILKSLVSRCGKLSLNTEVLSSTCCYLKLLS